MTPQELKSSILQLAVQGKLVEQRAEEGTAEELYRQIQEEKQRLIKEGKIKKEKPLPAISEDEIPFDIPDSWKWVRLGNIGSWSSGATPSRTHPEYYGGNIPWLKTGDLNDGYVIDIPESITESALENSSVRLNPTGSVLMAMYGATIGKLGILQIEATTNQACCACIPYNGIYNLYLFYYLLSSRHRFTKMGEGGAQPNISKQKIIGSLFPLPPLAEQKRIVAKIEELLPYVDRYEKAWSKLEDFNKRFPADMQKSVLQMAIQGKLVEQRPEEGTGEELYKQIQTEKAKLIKEGKIKKVKPLSEISEDEIPFEIPESWIWVRLNNVIDVRDGTHGTPSYLPSGYPLITGKDFYTGFFSLDKTKYISEEDYKEISQRSKVEIDDILFSMIGGNIGSMIMITKDNFFEMAIKNVALFKQYNYTLSIADYLFVFLKSQVPIFQAIAKGGAQSFVPLNMLRNYLFPLPPLAEQKRIVQKLDDILPLCEKLK